MTRLRTLLAAFVAIATVALSSVAPAQTPNPVTPGYQVCTQSGGSTKCSFQPVRYDSQRGVAGLPMGAMAVTACGASSNTNGLPYVLEMDLTGKLCVSASVSASISGFTATSTGTPISVTTGGDTGSLPAGAVVVATNVGSNGAYCALGASATTASQYIAPNGGWFAFTVGASTQLTCVTASSTTTVNMTGGAGLPTGTGGGGGPGGGGAVTIADGADATQGAIADAAATAGSTGTISAKLRLMTTQLDNINTNVQGSIPAGSAIIGKVGIDQTTPGTTNAVSATNFPATVSTGTGAQGASSPRVTVATDSATVAGSATLPAGTNTIGKVGQNPSVGGATPTFKSLSMSTATTTEIIPLSGSTVTYVTSLRTMAGGTANVTFKYGTGTNCGTGTTTLSGPWPLTAQAGFATGAGTGAIMIVPAGQALCVTSDAAVQVTTAATYQQL